MNPEQFQNFFNEKQRDPRLNELLYPFYTLEKSCEMILKFETDESFRKKSIKVFYFYSGSNIPMI
jgi:phosphatidylinositol phospholipase C beta